MKRLLICRHAKSSWKEAGLRDFDRPLNGRGKNDAPEMGRRLLAHGVVPELILSSSAIRAAETARHYAVQLGYPLDQIRFDSRQYEAGIPLLLSLIKDVDQKVTSLMVVGHNPESTMLANYLSGLMIENIPTSGIVALEFAVASWGEVSPGNGRLLFFDYPKKQS